MTIVEPFELSQMIDEVVPHVGSWMNMINYPPCANYLQGDMA